MLKILGIAVLVLFVGVISGGALFSGPVLAQEKKDKGVSKKRSFGLRGDGVGHVRMRPMMAPVAKKGSKRTRNIAITVVLTVRSKSKVGPVCNYGPRVSDALLRAWDQRPLLLSYLFDRGKNQGQTNIKYRRNATQKKEDKRLVRYVNKALGGKDVTGIIVLKGALSMGGGAITKLPFSNVNGCDELE